MAMAPRSEVRNTTIVIRRAHECLDIIEIAHEDGNFAVTCPIMILMRRQSAMTPMPREVKKATP